jgi:hypothetical protein
VTAQMLRISGGLSLPADAVTQTVVILAKARGREDLYRARPRRGAARGRTPRHHRRSRRRLLEVLAGRDGKDPGMPIIVVEPRGRMAATVVLSLYSTGSQDA